MPSLWDLLCVSRKKYTTEDTRPKPRRTPRQSRWEDPPYHDPADANYYIQPEYHHHHHHRKTVEPYPRETWHDSGGGGGDVGHSNNNKPNARIEAILRDKTKERADSVPLLSDHKPPGHRYSEHMPILSQSPRVDQEPLRHNVYKDEEEEKRRDADTAGGGKRRHVQDIFLEGPKNYDARYHPQDTSPSYVASSSQGIYRPTNRQSHESPRARQTESMYQYSPRTVNDHAVSAALFGNRIDDFVHDPGWNRAIDRFAASPTSSSSSFFFSGDRNVVSAQDRPVSGSENFSFRDSPRYGGNDETQPSSGSRVSSSRGRGLGEERTASQSHSQPNVFLAPSVVATQPSSLSVDEAEKRTERAAGSRRSDAYSRGVFIAQDGNYNDGGSASAAPGTGVDIVQLFSGTGDVLY